MKLSNILKLTSFIMAGTLSLTIVLFSVIMLGLKNDSLTESEKTVYFSLMSSIFGLWIPSPTSIVQLKNESSSSDVATSSKNIDYDSDLEKGKSS